MTKGIGCALIALLLCGFTRQAAAGGSPQASPSGAQEMHGMSGMPGMSAPSKAQPPASQPWCEDRTWSTFNHRMSGWFLLLWGLTALIAGLQWPRRTWVRFAPAMILFGLAEFLFFRNDPEAWPVGPMSFAASLHDPEDFQHRIFLLLVILIALIEVLRAADRLPGFLAKFGLPALGAFGATLLFFHKHGGPEMDMNSTQGVASMNLVRHEHFWFSTFGFALVAAKLVADAGYLKGRKAALWTVFAILLGAYMIGYVE